MATELWAIVLVIFATFVGAGGPILLKKAANRIDRSIFTSFRSLLSATVGNRFLIIGILLLAVALILYIFALQGADLSVLYPLVSLTYVWVSLLSVRFLNERMNAAKWAGVFVIVAGAFLVGFGS